MVIRCYGKELLPTQDMCFHCDEKDECVIARFEQLLNEAQESFDEGIDNLWESFNGLKEAERLIRLRRTVQRRM